ncbi:hypothetical protein EV121DRAFT_174676, partial [Schizophyllum commune]
DVDYEKKYAPDAYGKELSKNARVWSVYNDEAQIADEAMVKELNGTLDVLLVFAGLFSAVVTTFVAQSSQALNPDYAQITASLIYTPRVKSKHALRNLKSLVVYESVLMQRAIRAGTSGEVPASSLNLASRTSQTTDLWVNGLWLHYNSLSTGSSPRDRAHLRHFRLLGFQRWKVQAIVGFLPVLLTVALLLFFAGLIVYVVPMDAVISWVIIGLSCAILLLYALVTVLPIFISHCAYKTPLAHYLLALRIWIEAECLYRPLDFLLRRINRRPTFRLKIWRLSRRLCKVLTAKEESLKDRESYAVWSTSDALTGSALKWLIDFPINVSAANISSEAASALMMQPDKQLADHLLKRSADRILSVCATSPMLDREHVALAERLTRMAMHSDSLHKYYNGLWFLGIWEQLYTYRNHPGMSAPKAILCVVRWYRFCEEALVSASALNRALDAFSLLDMSSTELKLHPVVWCEIHCGAKACLLLCKGQRPTGGSTPASARYKMIIGERRHAQYTPSEYMWDPYEDTAVTLNEYCRGCGWEGGRKKFLDDLEKLK